MTSAVHAQLLIVWHARRNMPDTEQEELAELDRIVRRHANEQRIRAAFPGVDPSTWPDEFSGRTTLADKGWW